MKKIILLTLTALIMVWCSKREDKREYKDGWSIATIDSCEYIVTHPFGSTLIHHNNYRFCKERRQKELEELVTKLKEK